MMFFYVKPKASIPDSPADPWYMNLAVGHNTLSGMLMKVGNLGKATIAYE